MMNQQELQFRTYITQLEFSMGNTDRLSAAMPEAPEQKGDYFEQCTVPCEGPYVADSLTSEIEHFKSPIFINAPTGAGKNRFVFGPLAEYARKKGEYILVLSNRRALNLQQKEDLCDENEKLYSLEPLKDRSRYNNIILLTYQSIQSEIWSRVRGRNLTCQMEEFRMLCLMRRTSFARMHYLIQTH